MSSERLSPGEWAAELAQVPMGQQRRFGHICGPGRTLLVSRDVSGGRAWCFRCGAGGNAPPPRVSLAEALEMAQAGRLADVEMAATPHPEPAVLDVREWPVAARVWLFKAGLGYPEIAKLGAYYHPPSKRVVLPTVDGLNTYWQARSVDGRQPKYLGAQTGKALVVPKYGPQTGPIHVTEDILSAFKIGLAGARAWCALGTRLSAKFLADLMDTKQPARIWLDPDEGGRVGTSKIKKQLDAYGVPNETLLSREDPKRHTLDEIRSIIGQLQ